MILFVMLFSCGGKKNSPTECVNSFISAAMSHDMSKAWGNLSPEAQASYNEIGEKNRKSGKGILEHDISEITKFRIEGKDYTLAESPRDEIIITFGNEEITVVLANVNGVYQIKDWNSVKNIIKAIAAETVKKEYYF